MPNLVSVSSSVLGLFFRPAAPSIQDGRFYARLKDSDTRPSAVLVTFFVKAFKWVDIHKQLHRKPDTTLETMSIKLLHLLCLISLLPPSDTILR